MEFIYALDRTEGVTPILTYSEQGAGFAACGYAQATGKLAAAYGTRGPGFTNLISCIAEAYCESLPVLFISAHSNPKSVLGCRVETEQEIDTVDIVRTITKYAQYIDDINDVVSGINRAIYEATSERPGPVFLDINSELWKREIQIYGVQEANCYNENTGSMDEFVISSVLPELARSKTPILLIGDGVRQAGGVQLVRQFVDEFEIPCVSSRGSQMILGGHKLYYGYIGSHGMRYANSIFEESDVVICIGNRLSFPPASISYKMALANKRIIWVDIDSKEIGRDMQKCNSICGNLTDFISCLSSRMRDAGKEWVWNIWINRCNELRNEFKMADLSDLHVVLTEIIREAKDKAIFVADVGNNEFALSRAYENASSKNIILYSKSFGTLGCGIPKAIGVVAATNQPVICLCGDQGFQMNMQELNLIQDMNLPICILVHNNRASGMIRDKEKRFGYELHTSSANGYCSLNFERIAFAYGIDYRLLDCLKCEFSWDYSRPLICEIRMDEDLVLCPNLLRGSRMSEMSPIIKNDLLPRS